MFKPPSAAPFLFLSTLYENEMGQQRAGRCVMLWLFPDVLPSAPETWTEWSYLLPGWEGASVEPKTPRYREEA